MKTIQDFIKEIEGSAELQAELDAIKDDGALAAFLKEHDVDGTAEQLLETVKAKMNEEGELSDEEAEATAGGLSITDVLKMGMRRFGVDEYGNPKAHPLQVTPRSEFDFRDKTVIVLEPSPLDEQAKRWSDKLKSAL